MSEPAVVVFSCHNRTCRRDGAAAVYAALRGQIEAAGLAEVVEVRAVGCLGMCGSGPMLLVIQKAAGEEIWYDRMRPEEAALLVREHLIEGRPVADMLCRARHPKRSIPAWTPLPPPWHPSPNQIE